MATMTIKNLPERVYRALKRRAKRNRRSINQEAIVLLEDALLHERVDPAVWLEETRAARSRLAAGGFSTSIEELDRYKREGRE